MISHSPKKKGWLVDFPWLSKVPEVDFDGMPPWSGIPFGRGQELSAERSWTLPGKPWIYQRVTAYDAKEWAARFGESSPQGVDVWETKTKSSVWGGGGDPTPFFFTFVSPFCDSASVYYNVQTFFSSQILNSHLIQEILLCFHPFLPFKSLVRWAAVGCHYLNSYKHPRLITSKCGPCRHVGGYLCFG